jgi:hypothetical protein
MNVILPFVFGLIELILMIATAVMGVVHLLT